MASDEERGAKALVEEILRRAGRAPRRLLHWITPIGVTLGAGCIAGAVHGPASYVMYPLLTLWVLVEWFRAATAIDVGEDWWLTKRRSRDWRERQEMTKYVAIGRALHSVKESEATSSLALIASRIADVSAADNPYFDRERFLRVVETGEDMPG